MRVLYVSVDDSVHDRRFLSKLAGARHQVWHLPLLGPGPPELGPLPSGVHRASVPGMATRPATPAEWLPIAPALAAVVDQVHPDLVQAGPVQSGGFLAAVRGVRPLLLMSWGSDVLVDADRDAFSEWATRYTLDHSDMVLCDCDAARAKIQHLTAYDDGRIVQFPYGTDVHAFRPGEDATGLRRRLGWEGVVVVVSTRLWEPIYKIDVLLEAFHRAHARSPALRLLLLGDGSLRSMVDRSVAECGLGEVVYRPGRVPPGELPHYFRAADVYMSCTASDGTSVSLLEALATGLPAIVTDRFGNREWITPGENGWLVPPDDPEAFGQALSAAACLTAAQRERITRRNRQVAVERADWDANFPRLLEAYARITSAHPARPGAADSRGR